MQWSPRQRRKRRFYFRYTNRTRILRFLLCLFALSLLLFGLGKLVNYAVEMANSKRATENLRQVYAAVSGDENTLATDCPFAGEDVLSSAAHDYMPQPEPSSEPTPIAMPTATPEPMPTAVPRLAVGYYSENPQLQTDYRIRELQKTSKYIIGWLNIERLIDEPVVQRNNVFFLDHDVSGKPNSNGTVFLDSIIQLKNRPYAYILYGHNMKSGAMFGGLRNYENMYFYHNNPFVNFTTMYEDNRYVIFAVGTISTEENHRNYLDFLSLASRSIPEREKAISAIISNSVYTSTIDVQPEDQLLLLVTCVGNDLERRIVAARCIRPGEDEGELKRMIEKSTLRK